MPRNGCKSGRPRILYIHPDTMGLPTDPAKNPLHYLSRHLTGDYLAVWWSPDDRRERSEADRRINEASGAFAFHWNRSYKLPQGLRQVWDLVFYVGKGLALTLRGGKYDAIVAYGPYRTGLAGYLLKLLTGAKLILEMPGNPRKSLSYESGFVNRMKRGLGPAMVKFIVGRSDHVWLRYPTQLDDLTLLEPAKVTVFPNFVPIRTLPAAANNGMRYILFIGHPWYLKGVDILIRAFNQIWRKHPDVKLVIMGHCPDRTPFIELAGDNPNVEFHPGTPHPEAMKVMAKCSVFVLPSRTDAMARVLIEAMASEKPIIASRVDGTPFYVEDGKTGLLFTSENADELAERLDQVLCDPALAATLASNASAYAHRYLNEEAYAAAFRHMVARTIGGANESGAAGARPHPPWKAAQLS